MALMKRGAVTRTLGKAEGAVAAAGSPLPADGERERQIGIMIQRLDAILMAVARAIAGDWARDVVNDVVVKLLAGGYRPEQLTDKLLKKMVANRAKDRMNHERRGVQASD